MTEPISATVSLFPFRPGEEMPMHEFERRFMDSVCGGVLPHYAQTRVRIVAVGETLKIEIHREEVKSQG